MKEDVEVITVAEVNDVQIAALSLALAYAEGKRVELFDDGDLANSFLDERFSEFGWKKQHK